MILHGSLLAKDPWFTNKRNEKAAMRLAVRNSAQASQAFAIQSPDGRFPESLEVIEKKFQMDLSRLRSRDFPYEPMLYLGAGLSLSSDDALPLCISPPYLINGISYRQLVTIGGEEIQIRDDELDTWLDRVLPQAGKPAP